MEKLTPTPHNAAVYGEIAKVVLMPGDPLRAKYIAETYLTDAKLVSDVRNVYAYTGLYRGKQISVMASGMGTSSMGIYSYELFHFYSVDVIIRVGSAGGLSPSLQMMDVVAGTASSTDTGFALHMKLPGTIAPTADYTLVAQAVECGKNSAVHVVPGPIFCGEALYYDKADMQKWADIGMLAVEMESAALYLNAAKAKKKALTLCTISDMVLTEGETTSEQRVIGFNEMIKIALEVAYLNVKE